LAPPLRRIRFSGYLSAGKAPRLSDGTHDGHSRLYSAIFVTVAVASLAISRVASPIELLLVGLTFLVGGAFSILGLVLVDASEDTVDWTVLGTWVWIGAFAVLFVSGLALTLRSRAAVGRPTPA
jgi:hypothetical protein